MPPAPRKPASSLSALRGNMEKKWGSRVTRQSTITNQYEVVSTGSMTLDVATRVGGLIRGRTHEIVGPEGVGKTTLVTSTAREHQLLYPSLGVGYIDMEQTWDWSWAEKNGLDVAEDRFLHVYPDDSEDVSDQIKEMIRDGLLSCCIIDSIGGMESREAFAKDAEKSNMGKNSQIISRMVKQCATLARQTKTTIIFVNQYRANFASPTGGDVSAGPKALKYNTTMKIDMRRTSTDPLKVKIGDEDETVGVHVRARVSRSKVAPQGLAGEFFIINQETEQYGPVGIDQADEAVTVGIKLGVIDQGGGGYYTLPNSERIRGRDNVLDYLRSHRDMALDIRDKALAKVKGEVFEEEQVEFTQETAEASA